MLLRCKDVYVHRGRGGGNSERRMSSRLPPEHQSATKRESYETRERGDNLHLGAQVVSTFIQDFFDQNPISQVRPPPPPPSPRARRAASPIADPRLRRSRSSS